MPKSIKLKNNTYWDTKGIMYQRHNLENVIQERKINVSSSMIEQKWLKLCNITFDNHTQGEFIFLRIFIGQGNNGKTNQNAYIDLIGQLGWKGSNSGRLGLNAELHPLATSYTTSNLLITVIANSYIDYDVWIKTGDIYCRPNYVFYGSNRANVIPKWEKQENAPSGTICDLAFTSV